MRLHVERTEVAMAKELTSDGPSAPAQASLTVVAGPGHPHDPNRLRWPPRTSEVLMAFFLAGVGFCLVENRPAEITLPLIAAALLAGLSPRMTGKWGYQSANVAIGGEFADPFADLPTPVEPRALAPAPAQLPAQSAKPARKRTPREQSREP